MRFSLKNYQERSLPGRVLFMENRFHSGRPDTDDYLPSFRFCSVTPKTGAVAATPHARARTCHQRLSIQIKWKWGIKKVILYFTISIRIAFFTTNLTKQNLDISPKTKEMVIDNTRQDWVKILGYGWEWSVQGRVAEREVTPLLLYAVPALLTLYL